MAVSLSGVQDEGVAGRVPLSVCFGWGAGNIGIAIMATVFGTLYLRFLTDYLDIAAGAAAAMVVVSKLYDAVIDPAIGALSDRTRTRIGRRRPYIVLVAFLAPFCILAQFAPPPISGRAMLHVYVGATLMLYTTVYALAQVPYLAMAAEMTDNYNERSRVLAYRLNAGAIGQLLAGGAGPWLLAYWGGGRGAYAAAACVLGAIASLGFLYCFVFTRRAPFHPVPAKPVLPPWSQRVWMIATNRPLFSILLSKTAWFIAAASSSATAAYYLPHVLGLGIAWLGTYGVLVTAGMIASVQPWLWLGRRMEKRNAALMAAGLYALTQLSWLYATREDPHWLLVARMLCQGVGLAGFQLFVQSMFVDTIDYDYRRTGVRREGAVTGLYTLVEKTASAAGIAGVGAALSIAGYASGVHGVADQTADALSAVRLMFTAAPAAMVVLAAAALLLYPLTAAKLAATRRA